MPFELDAPDLGLGQREVDAGHVSAHRREHALHAGARIGRAAHHLQALAAGIDLADLQLVGVGMLLAFHHFRHAERFQRGLRIEQLLDLEPDAGQRLADRLQRSLSCRDAASAMTRVNFMAQDSPAARVGMASGGKP